MNVRFVAAITAAVMAAGTLAAQEQDGASFQSGVELINVTATVTDGEGRFVSGLRREDFRVYEDGELQEITHFNNDRAPVSLGIALDTSGSMDGEKMRAARAADIFWDVMLPLVSSAMPRLTGARSLLKWVISCSSPSS